VARNQAVHAALPPV